MTRTKQEIIGLDFWTLLACAPVLRMHKDGMVLTSGPSRFLFKCWGRSFGCVEFQNFEEIGPVCFEDRLFTDKGQLCSSISDPVISAYFTAYFYGIPLAYRRIAHESFLDDWQALTLIDLNRANAYLLEAPIHKSELVGLNGSNFVE